MNHGMIDLETYGLRAGCAFRSIAIVQFDPYSDRVGEKFYANVTRASCEEIGMFVDPDTEKWWNRQSAEAQEVLTKDQVHIREAMERAWQFWLKMQLKYPWSQGANYDQPLIEEAWRLCGIKPPYKFWDSRCTRTAYGMSGFNVFSTKNPGIPHYALDDCLHQIRCVQSSFKKLGLRN